MKNEYWKCFLFQVIVGIAICILLLPSGTKADGFDSIRVIEYYFDQDPGIGNGIVLNTDSTPAYVANEVIDISALSEGIHTIYFRPQDTTGVWGVSFGKSFYVYGTLEIDSTDVLVTDIEYSFDSISNFIPISGIDPDTLVSVTANLDINNLIGPGNHIVYFRAKDANDYFSIIVSDTFNVENDIPVANAGSDQLVNAGSLTTLDGTASYDPNKLAITYLWTAPGIISLSSNTDSKPTFTTPEVITDTTFMFTLVVNDGIFDSPADTVLIIVMHINLAIADKTFESGSVECFDAFDTITVAGGSTTVYLQNGSNTSFIAGKSIRFLPGFHALSGSYMDANITTNSSFCIPPAPGIVALEPSGKSVIEKNNQKPDKKGFLEKSVKIYPNPNIGKFTLELSNFENPVKVSMVNMVGATIYSRQQIISGIYEMDLSGIDKGIYIVRIIDGETLLSKKIVVQ
jgi:hypothetical protein